MTAGSAPDPVALAMPERQRNDTACGEERVAQEVIMHLQLIEDMNRQGKHHAALAHLDALGERGEKLPRSRFLRAEASRQVGDKAAAQKLFTELTTSCLAGLGHHGLARLAMEDGDMEQGLVEFVAASKERPTDPRIRNDHGYALLLSGDATAARHQFQTGHELGGGDQVSANLLLTLYVLGEHSAAEALAGRLPLSQQELADIKTHADELRSVPAAARPRKQEHNQ
jgi:Flp pilus assembly protein TadD